MENIPTSEVFVPKIEVLGVKVGDIDEKTAISRILTLAKDTKGHHYVVTVNAEFVMLARRNPDFARIVESADLALADGAGVVLAKLILGGKAHSRVTGVDMVDKLCAESAKRAIRVGFLGGFHAVASEVSKRQKAKFPGLKVVYIASGSPIIGYDLRLRKAISASGRVDILFVAFGMGGQEFWISRNIKHLNVGVAIGVGGAFDYISSVKMRAPRFVQRVGLEWLWRLVLEPARIWRMRVLPVFAELVIWQFLKKLLKF
ncbi:MAG: WecB/TagA/CpsF family glycosyltransferase [Candidatus Curtissbacteria bacterium]|nr:WecB/TagA/CpsF family glycosyltransferase [Candidatus Curtissbacteria bacterium]